MELHVLSEKLFGFNLHRHAYRHLRDHFIPHEGNNHKPHVLHHRALFLYSALLVLVKVSVLTLPVLLPYSQAASLAITTENIFELTNQSRVDYNLPALIQSPKLMVAAQNKARDMMDKGYFAHYSPEGVSPWYWVTEAGYTYSYAGENLAIRFSTAEGVTEAWLASPAHRANLLSDDFTQMGVAVITDNFGGEEPATVVVQMFGTPALGNIVERGTVPAADNTSLSSGENPVSSQPVAASPNALPVEITFPLNDSYVNNSQFKIIGHGTAGERVQIFLDEKFLAELAIADGKNFEFAVPKEAGLQDGDHSLFAAVKDSGLKSPVVDFSLDTTIPQIYINQFEFSKKAGSENIYLVKVVTDKDSIRTIVSVGTDSAVLNRTDEKNWSGEIVLYNQDAKLEMPVEIMVQDIAGNEAREQLGVFKDGSVKSIFSIAGSESGDESVTLELFGGLIKIPNWNDAAQNFFLLMVAFLAFSLILKIAINRHVQHVGTIAGSSGVIILALLLFTF